MGIRTFFAAALALGLAAPAVAADRLYVFGDSLVDSGNAETQSPGSAALSGRFTNGLNFADDLSIALGFGPATAYLQGGINYAVGGATVAPWPGQGLIPDLGAQITNYYEASINSLDPASARPAIDANSLVLVAAGGNDVRDYARYGAPAPVNTVNDLGIDLSRLIADGARNIIVVGVPDIGLIPSVVGTSSEGAARQLSQQLNSGYGQVVSGIQAQLGSSGSIKLFDLYALQHDVTDHPASYGVDPSLLTKGCVDNGGLVTNCAGYAYYDGIHPTAALHGVIAQRLEGLLPGSSLPEPSTWALIIMGFGVIGAALRRRRFRGMVAASGCN